MKIQKILFLVFFLPAISISHFGCSQTDYKATQNLNNTNDSLALINDLTDSLKLKLKDSLLSSVADNSKKQTLQIIGVGDMMFGTNFPSAAHLPPNQGKNLISEVDSILKSADITFGNLEGVVLDKGGQVKHCSNPAVCYAFRMLLLCFCFAFALLINFKEKRNMSLITRNISCSPAVSIYLFRASF